jgi:hypothetical protein
LDINSEELKAFVSSAVKSITDGLNEQNYVAAGGCIEFELAVVKTKEKGAGIKIYVVDASAKYRNEVVSRIKFHAAPKGSTIDRSFR